MLPALLDELRRRMGARVTGSELAFFLPELSVLEAQASLLRFLALSLSARCVPNQSMPLRVDEWIKRKRQALILLSLTRSRLEHL